jgi:hypothetical protein
VFRHDNDSISDTFGSRQSASGRGYCKQVLV